MRRRKGWFALPLAALLLGQTVAPELPALLHAAELPEAPEPANTGGLQITILEGEGALNNIRQRTAREPIVQVEDKNHKPVAAAAVIFAINPGSNGAGAAVNGTQSFSVHTNSLGIATARNFQPNRTIGNFTITVTAVAGMYTITTLIHQSNYIPGVTRLNRLGRVDERDFVERLAANPVKLSLVLGGVAAAGVVTGILLTRNSGTSLTAGTGTVGRP